MAKAKFFSNSIIKLDHTENEIVSSLRDTRGSWREIFTVPEHTVGTKNLLIFIDGKICVPGRDYTDINSNSVKFTNRILESQDFHSILMKTSKDIVHVEDGNSIEWESF